MLCSVRISGEKDEALSDFGVFEFSTFERKERAKRVIREIEGVGESGLRVSSAMVVETGMVKDGSSEAEESRVSSGVFSTKEGIIG